MPKRPMRVDVLVGRNIRICRLQRGFTQTELGGHLGVTAQQIQKYENGANRVGASRLNQLAGALGVSIATLFDGRPSNDNERPSNGRAGYGHGTPDLDGGALLTNRHALRLVQAFAEIPSTRRRSAILRLIELIGNGKPKHRRGRLH